MIFLLDQHRNAYAGMGSALFVKHKHHKHHKRKSDRPKSKKSSRKEPEEEEKMSELITCLFVKSSNFSTKQTKKT